MTLPTKDWTDIVDAQVDAESPLDTTLMTQIRDNLVNLKEWIGYSYTAARDHDHDGLNSKTVLLADGVVTTAKLAGANVTLSKLKFAQGSWSGSIGSHAQVQIAINRYSHLYQSYSDSTGGRVYLAVRAPYGGLQTGLAVFNDEVFSVTASLSWDYHTD